MRVNDGVKLVFVLGQTVDLQQGKRGGGQCEKGWAVRIDQAELLPQVLGAESHDQVPLELEDCVHRRRCRLGRPAKAA